MSCKKVHELLPEWTEGSLAPEQRARIEEHAAACAGCSTLLKEARDAEVRMRGVFLQAADSVTLAPQFERKLVRELSTGVQPPSREAEQTGWFSFLRLALGAAVGLMLLGLLIWRLEPQPEGSGPKGNVTAQKAARATVAYVLADYEFREEGELVWDTIMYRTNVLDLRLWAKAEAKGTTSERRKKL